MSGLIERAVARWWIRSRVTGRQGRRIGFALLYPVRPELVHTASIDDLGRPNNDARSCRENDPEHLDLRLHMVATREPKYTCEIVHRRHRFEREAETDRVQR